MDNTALENRRIEYKETFEVKEYERDKDLHTGFMRMLWINTFRDFTVYRIFNEKDKIIYGIMKNIFGKKEQIIKGIKGFYDKEVHSLLKCIPLSEYQAYKNVKNKSRVRRVMITNKAYGAQERFLLGNASKNDIAILEKPESKELYGILDLEKLRQYAVKNTSVGFLDNLQRLVGIADGEGSRNSDKINAIRTVNDMMNYCEKPKDTTSEEDKMQNDLSGISTQDLEKLIKDLD